MAGPEQSHPLHASHHARALIFSAAISPSAEHRGGPGSPRRCSSREPQTCARRVLRAQPHRFAQRPHRRWASRPRARTPPSRSSRSSSAIKTRMMRLFWRTLFDLRPVHQPGHRSRPCRIGDGPDPHFSYMASATPPQQIDRIAGDRFGEARTTHRHDRAQRRRTPSKSCPRARIGDGRYGPCRGRVVASWGTPRLPVVVT